MLQRIYINNFRCLENFELTLKDIPSALLIGKNGVGKSAISYVLQVFQSVGRGINRVNQLIEPKDFSRGRSDVPIRFEIEVFLKYKLYKYILAFDLTEESTKIRVFEEQLLVAGNPIYSRKKAQINLEYISQNHEAQFSVDWYLVALPIMQEISQNDPLHIFRTWLDHMIILAPIPSLMTGESNQETLEPKRNASNIGEWLSGLLGRYPAAYREIDKYLREIMPDFEDFRNEIIGKNSKNLLVQFKVNDAYLNIDFEDLSDGEKCFFLCGVVLAATKFYELPVFCFWDEPDNYLSISEVGHFIVSLRRSFKNSGQILVTSHNSEAIQKFSDENTFFLDRKNHLEPTLIRPLSQISVSGDLINSLICGYIEL